MTRPPAPRSSTSWEAFGDQAKARYGARIVYPSDEWYLCAGRPIPPAAFYEDYAQLENGGGDVAAV